MSSCRVSGDTLTPPKINDPPQPSCTLYTYLYVYYTEVVDGCIHQHSRQHETDADADADIDATLAQLGRSIIGLMFPRDDTRKGMQRLSNSKAISYCFITRNLLYCFVGDVTNPEQMNGEQQTANDTSTRNFKILL